MIHFHFVELLQFIGMGIFVGIVTWALFYFCCKGILWIVDYFERKEKLKQDFLRKLES